MNEYLENVLRRENIAYKTGEDLSKKSYIKIGVTADVIYPKSKSELLSVVGCLLDIGIDFKILGAMSNLLLTDSSARYLFVSTEHLRGISEKNGQVRAMSGVRFSSLFRYLLNKNYSLLPELFGIPGSVGGMLYSNAGAFGKELSEALVSAELFDFASMSVRNYSAEEMRFGYRNSILQDGGYMLISATFLPHTAPKDEILQTVGRVTGLRRATQPIEYRSLGSVFKRPQGDYAARLIDEAGLRGLRVGDAQVSEKHAGFIVNLGSATADDVLELIRIIKNKVYSVYGVSLTEEIEILR